MTAIQIATHDCTCPSYVFRPSAVDAGPSTAVLVFMDGLELRG